MPDAPEPEARISLPVRLDILVSMLSALRGEFPEARVRNEGDALVVVFPEPSEDDHVH